MTSIRSRDQHLDNCQVADKSNEKNQAHEIPSKQSVIQISKGKTKGSPVPYIIGAKGFSHLFS